MKKLLTSELYKIWKNKIIFIIKYLKNLKHFNINFFLVYLKNLFNINHKIFYFIKNKTTA